MNYNSILAAAKESKLLHTASYRTGVLMMSQERAQVEKHPERTQLNGLLNVCPPPDTLQAPLERNFLEVNYYPGM